MARRICNMPGCDRLWEVLEVQAESFPSFDLTVLTIKQFDVLVMRYRGLLSERKMAAFEGVSRRTIRVRHATILVKMQAQIYENAPILHHSRGTAHADRIPRTAAGYAGSSERQAEIQSGAADVAAGGGGCDTMFASWEELYEQEASGTEGDAGAEDDCLGDPLPRDSEAAT